MGWRDEDRKRILNFLNDEPKTVREISAALKIRFNRVGKKIRKLERAGKVFQQGDGYCSTSVTLDLPDEDVIIWPKSRPGCWKATMIVALRHNVPARGYHPCEIIEMLKTMELGVDDVVKLKWVCDVLGVDYDAIKPARDYWRRLWRHNNGEI